MSARRSLRMAILAGGLLAGAAVTTAQDTLSVTGVSRRGAAVLEPTGGEAIPLTPGRAIAPGTLKVEADARLMLFEPSGTVLIVLGPAEAAVARDEIGGGTQLELLRGRIVVVAGTETRGLTLFAQLADAARTDVEWAPAPGHVYAERSGAQIKVAYVPEGTGGELELQVAGSPVRLGAGQALVVADGESRTEALGDWLSQQGFTQAWGRELGVASAQVARAEVEARLFDNVITWDRYAGATYVVQRLREQRFNLEIRATVQAVTTANRSSQRGGEVQTAPFPGANAVPVISPAAASVQDPHSVGQNLTAIQLNNSAARLLEATGSRGLGFQGLRLLAVPGVTSTGTRTIGPAGLGAQQN
jgi:hypothetical protein